MFLPWIGLEVGLLSVFYEYVFVNLHFHHDAHIPFWTYLAQVFLAHSAYGYDRLMDVRTRETDNRELVRYVEDHATQVTATVSVSTILGVLYLLQNQHTAPLVFPFLLSVFCYRHFKKNFPLWKPFYICTMIVVSSVVVPSIMTENNLSILSDWGALVPPFSNLYSSSNYLDILDSSLDRSNNITTLPVLYGNRTAVLASFMANVLSLVSHTSHPYFGDPTDYLFQSQNIISGLNLFNRKQTDFRKVSGKDNHRMDMSLHPSCRRLYFPLVPPVIPRCIPRLLV